MNEQIKQEIINRYKYLYKNKELILSLCIDKKIRTKYYKDQIAKHKKLLSKIQKLNSENQTLIDLVNLSIEDNEKALVTPKYYLMNDIPNYLITLLEKFLFCDETIENTALYALIENIKADERKLLEAYEKINGLIERRSHNKFLCNKDSFTVWRILNYVRNKNKDNKAVLDVLDKYYNIERYISTGINWNSGYYLLNKDVNNNENYLNGIYNNIILGKIKTQYEYSAIMFKYEGNEFEQEDDYFVYEWSIEFVEKPKCNNNLSLFMTQLNNIGMLREDEKQQLYLELKKTKENSLKRNL